MTLADFRALFPEFDTASDALVTAKLTEAESNTSDTWQSDSLREEFIGLRTAHALNTSPSGRNARIDPRSGVKSPYYERMRAIMRSHACVLNRVG